MQQDDPANDPLNYHDDNRVLRYLLHNVKGLSPVSGGVLGEALENEYESAEDDAAAGQDLDFGSDV
ncbi:MAG: hypothetical protein JWO07_49 [Candidatus Saccharibacteria bacterium]|nr:hypothetical protein [Candidatus Saccharibacteria bacterium]